MAEKRWSPSNEPQSFLLNDASLAGENLEDSFELYEKFGIVFDTIRHKDAQTPISVMVTGDWGSGKTSSMRWLEKQLKEWNASIKAKEGRVKVDTCWFYPWKYDTKEEVWKGLIAEVICASIDFDDTAKVVKAARQFGSFLGAGFVKLLSATKFKASAGVDDKTKFEAEFNTKEALSGIIEEYGKHVTPQAAYYNTFEETLKTWVQDCYPRGKSRLCIFIDDLDRCMPDIALQVLEALKLYLNIEQLIFIVGVDKQVINNIVEKRYEDLVGQERFNQVKGDDKSFAHKAAKYLDKLFQIEVDIQPNFTQVKSFVQERLEGIPGWKELGDENLKYLNIYLNRKIEIRAINKIKTAFTGSKRLEAIQALFLADECLDWRADVSEIGPQFFYEWSQAVKASKAEYLPFEQIAPDDGDDVKEDKIDDFTALRQLWKKNANLPHHQKLLLNKNIGLLMKLPYPKPTVGKDWVEILAPIIAKVEGISPEAIDEAYLLQISELDLEGQEFLNDELTYLKCLRHVVNLDLGGTNVSDETLVHLREIKGLSILTLDRTSISDSGLAVLGELESSRSLSLAETKITDKGLSHLESLVGLTELSLDQTSVTDSGLSHLAKLSSLFLLSLAHTNFTGNGLIHLRSLHQMRSLSLRHTEVTDETLINLKNIPSLTFLDLSYCVVSDVGLRVISDLTNLRMIRLDSTNITDAGLEQLITRKELHIIHLRGTSVTDEGLGKLERLKHLTGLYVDTITDERVSSLLTACPGLVIRDSSGRRFKKP